MLGGATETPHGWWWLFPTITAVSALGGGLLGSFFSKRGEIAAIQTQLGTVVEQNKRIVEGTEQIKQEFSGRQRLWELKREAAYDVMKTIGAITEIFAAYGSAWMGFHKFQESLTSQGNSPEDHETNQLRGRKLLDDIETIQARYKSEIKNISQAAGIASLLFNTTIINQVNKLVRLSNDTLRALQSQQERSEVVGAFNGARAELIALFQAELTLSKSSS